MTTPKTRMLVAVLALSFPAFALAQNVVPPPVQPGTVQSAQPTVAPPMGVSSANPAAAQVPAPVAPPTQNLIDIALPDAPKPSAADLKPTAPTQAVARKAAAKSSVVKAVNAPVKVDPYAGLVGTPVSDAQLNRFSFPEAVEGVYFPEGAPLSECPENAGPQDPCKPIFLNGKKLMLLQLRAGAKGPIQMLVHLASGRMLTLNLAPTAGPGAVVRIEGAEDGASDSRLASGSTSNAVTNQTAGAAASEAHVALLSQFAAGDIPAGFEPIVVGKPVRFEHFDVIPLASWDNGANLRAHLYTIPAHGATPVLLDASLFRNPNVSAIALDRDTATKTAPAQLFLLETVPSENQQ